MRKDNEERAAYFAKLKKYDTEHAKRQQWYQKYIDQQVEREIKDSEATRAYSELKDAVQV